MATPSPSPALLALTASALAALGGRAHAQAAIPSATQADYRFSYYTEDALPADHVTAGDGERYEVSTHQFRVAQPLGADRATGLSADLTFETMSGATPMYAMPDAGGRPVDVMSGASIEDHRTELVLGLTRAKGGTSGTVSAGYSGENDYKALHGAVEVAHELDDKLTTLSLALGYSGDTVEPVQGKTTTGTLHDTRQAQTLTAGYGRVLDDVTVVQTTVGYTHHSGYLADPYKQAWVVSLANTVPDARPDSRQQLTWSARLRRFFRGADAALHADYRYYHDNWEVDAHSVDLAWHQNLGHGWRLVPGLRWYSQSQAFFYEAYYANARSDGLASSDYRLSPYGALSASLTASWDWHDWNASLGYQRYDSGTGYALGEVLVENPGLVDFRVVSLGLKKVF